MDASGEGQGETLGPRRIDRERPDAVPAGRGEERERSRDVEELERFGGAEGAEGGAAGKPPMPGDGPPGGARPDDSAGAQRDAQAPPPSAETAEFERKDTKGRWGLLPPKEAELLLRHNIREFPLRYRHWMDLYYKRVNQAGDR